VSTPWTHPELIFSGPKKKRQDRAWGDAAALRASPLSSLGFLSSRVWSNPALRLHLPYTVLLAVVGVAIGGLSSFLLYTPLTDVFDDIVRPVVDLPFNASIFLVVFLPLLARAVSPASARRLWPQLTMRSASPAR
jgi:hypothetical protein